MHLGASHVGQRVLGLGSVGIIGLVRKVVPDQRENDACRSLPGECAALDRGAGLCRVESGCYVEPSEGWREVRADHCFLERRQLHLNCNIMLMFKIGILRV